MGETTDLPGAAPREADCPASAEEALARATEHGRAAAAELLAALRSLLDAAALASSGEPSRSHALLGPLAQLLDGLAADVDPRLDAGARSLLVAVAEALDLEIARWEERAREDGDARAVLRAFLGLRELLWELGVRSAPRRPGPARAGVRRAERRRVQRVPVKG